MGLHRDAKPGRAAIGAILAGSLIAAGCLVSPARADENGLSFWLPGLNGSFAAAPGTPGWSFTTIYYHSNVSSGADAVFPRGGKVDVGLAGQGDLAVFGPSYVAEQAVLGGQLSLSLFGIGGRNQASVDATLTGPNGGFLSGSRSESFAAFGDLVPQAAIKWNAGVNNYMAYVTGDIPVGAYDPNRLANLGLGHGAIDAGAGYTYFDPATRREFSAVAGLTYNFENPDTDYQNGIDAHLDVAASQFLNDHLFAGAAAYLFQQVSDDSGAGATLGGYRSRVAGVGPQLGYKFDAGPATSGLISVKGFYEFAAQNRPDGWNVWLTLAFTPKPPAGP